MTSTKSNIGSMAESHLAELFEAIRTTSSLDECREFFEDLCTPAELRSMADRWRVARLLENGVPYRAIYEMTGVSTATITRVARAMSYGSGGYRTVLESTPPSITKETKEPSL
jgi:TrpR-related protein YerC/YecD